MTDETTYTDDDQGQASYAAPVAEEPASSGGSKRVVVLIAAIVGLLVVAGIVAAAVFFFVVGRSIEVEPAVPGDTVTTPGLEDQAAAEEPDAIGLNRSFTFRDIFDPLLEELPVPETPDGSMDTTPGATPGSGDVVDGVTLPPDTLFLRDVVSVDGVTSAVLYLNEQTYTLAPGGVISGTPWQVMSISGRSVVMLYGDVQVTLSIGQGVVSSAK